MNEEELNRYANNLAEMSLENGFDKDAYILKVLSEIWLKSNGKDVDLVPDSNADEKLKEVLNDFVVYHNTKDLQALKRFLGKTKQIISEIYHIAGTQEERKLVQSAIKSISMIA